MAKLKSAGVDATFFALESPYGRVASNLEPEKWVPALRAFMDRLMPEQSACRWGVCLSIGKGSGYSLEGRPSLQAPGNGRHGTPARGPRYGGGPAPEPI